MTDAAALTELEQGILAAAQPEVWVRRNDEDLDASLAAARRLEGRGLLTFIGSQQPHGEPERSIWEITPAGALVLADLVYAAGIALANKGRAIVRDGGADGQTYDDMLLLEIAKRAPGLSGEDLKTCFVAILMEYGTDALDAIRCGAVRFEKRAPQ